MRRAERIVERSPRSERLLAKFLRPAVFDANGAEFGHGYGPEAQPQPSFDRSQKKDSRNYGYSMRATTIPLASLPRARLMQ